MWPQLHHDDSAQLSALQKDHRHICFWVLEQQHGFSRVLYTSVHSLLCNARYMHQIYIPH